MKNKTKYDVLKNLDKKGWDKLLLVGEEGIENRKAMLKKMHQEETQRWKTNASIIIEIYKKFEISILFILQYTDLM